MGRASKVQRSQSERLRDVATRIAASMLECNGRSYASKDAQDIAFRYKQIKDDNPHLSFSECVAEAREQYILRVLREAGFE